MVTSDVGQDAILRGSCQPPLSLHYAKLNNGGLSAPAVRSNLSFAFPSATLCHAMFLDGSRLHANSKTLPRGALAKFHGKAFYGQVLTWDCAVPFASGCYYETS